jgi:hypothetical protein
LATRRAGFQAAPALFMPLFTKLVEGLFSEIHWLGTPSGLRSCSTAVGWPRLAPDSRVRC